MNENRALFVRDICSAFADTAPVAVYTPSCADVANGS